MFCNVSLFTVGLGGEDCSCLREPGELVQPTSGFLLEFQECPEATADCHTKLPICCGRQQVTPDQI